ncbi:hypothetical protein R7X12_03055 [Mesomycoplasma ovipneumoniae]|uniref:hypothetical protein n=1 Tax=Mesomycoplasma ovipneumoniae TaxID=29562 RepID=UPI002965149D|nr:hypothetical protein [Mesomycoplasma ovipneumoniae]MDW2915832.1 hypothetical protein [Mesomycoplasma ovipneumoniae]MDW2919463.1 hypothetical protein [Mesomycoplasma ovipneumoniae]MDW2921748.1 hypothetical protein [Mesomycoplasma ovipneumoniae]
MAYQNNTAQLLKSTKSWANILLIIRIVKFALGVITLIALFAGGAVGAGQSSTNPEDAKKAFSTILEAATIVLVIFGFWGILAFVYWILLIISPFKLNDLPIRMNLKNPHFISKFKLIFGLSIVAIFIPLISIIYLIMLRSFISKSEKEIIEDSLD